MPLELICQFGLKMCQKKREVIKYKIFFVKLASLIDQLRVFSKPKNHDVWEFWSRIVRSVPSKLSFLNVYYIITLIKHFEKSNIIK